MKSPKSWQWRRTVDELPENESQSLVYYVSETGHALYVLAFYVGGKWWDRGLMFQPTHWMSLAPPE